MAIARGAGTEIIRTSMFKGVNNTVQNLIDGEHHHIYTVLSVIFRCTARSGTEKGYFSLFGYDSKGGTTAQYIHLAQVICENGDTYVWNDKFSFMGYEPGDTTANIDTIAKQDAIADQGNTGTFPTGSQKLYFYTDSANTTYEVTCTFIDQNNA